MEITLAFVQGIVTITGILVVLGMVWAIQQINSVKRQIELMEYQVRDVDLNIQNRIDREIEDTHQTFRDVEVDIRSQLDSRLDKLTNQIIKQITKV